MLCVPLVIRGKIIGAIHLLLEREDREYNLFDLALAEDLADRAAIALDNATLYMKELEANRLKDEFFRSCVARASDAANPDLRSYLQVARSRPDG